MFDGILNYFSAHSVELNTQQIKLIESELQQRTYAKNEIMLRQGDLCSHTFFVQKGLLRAYTINENGKEHTLQFAPENWFISDRSGTLFNDISMQFIEAVEETETILIQLETFDKLAKLSDEFQRFNIFLLHNHIRQLQKRINQLLSATAEARYMSFIEMYPDIIQRVPQWMVASYLGITPESLSRVRKDLTKKHLER